jgi:hypothetical protein
LSVAILLESELDAAVLFSCDRLVIDRLDQVTARGELASFRREILSVQSTTRRGGS